MKHYLLVSLANRDRQYRVLVRRRISHLPRSAFSLVELLVVIAVIGIIMALSAPAYRAISSANNLTNAVTGIAGALERARAYAMAKNLYVYVGIAEVSSDQESSATPQTPATATNGGRIAVATVAVWDGTRGYTLLSNLTNPAWTNYNKGAGLNAPGNLEFFENVHLAATLGTPPATGGMARPTVAETSQLGNSACTSVTPFAWPLGSDLPPAQAQYYFQKVIQFDPRGTPRIQSASNQNDIVPWIEISLQQTHGSAIPYQAPTNTGAVAAIILDGVTGAARIYRP